MAHGLLPEIDNAARLLQEFRTSEVCRKAAMVDGEFCQHHIVSDLIFFGR